MRWIFILLITCLPSTCFSQAVQFPEDAKFFLVGDSFTNDGNADWAGKVDDLPPFEMDYFSMSGRNLAGMQLAFNANYVEGQYDAVVIAGGVNDVSGNRTALEMILSLTLMIAQTNGEHIILTTVAPFGGRPNFWSQGRQDIVDEYDDFVRQLAANSDKISLFDLRSLLDTDDDEAIDPDLSNDGLHPQNCAFGEECGMSMLADAFITQFRAPDFRSGDVDLNGVVNFNDIDPFIGLFNSGEYQQEADCNNDGLINFLDIGPFISILANSS
jgi:hypothetical protein